MTLPAWPPVLTRGTDHRRLLLSRAVFSHLSWWRRPSFLRPGGPKQETLFAGPWVGEFGWELMNWQAALRALRPAYRRIIVSSGAPSEALYRDFCDGFIPHHIQGTPNSHVALDIQHSEDLEAILDQVPADADHLVPQRYFPSAAQSFIRFGQAAEQKPLVLVHARGRSYVEGRNWPESSWQELVEGLQAQGLEVGAIGLKGSTVDLSGVDDLRDRPLDETMNHLSSAALVLGPSSGPLHLASLCGAPHLVWTDRRTYGMGKTSREKYETWWNPLRTPVWVMDEYGFNPPVSAVMAMTERALASE